MAAAAGPRWPSGDAADRSKIIRTRPNLSLMGYCSVSASGSPLRAASVSAKDVRGLRDGETLPGGSRSGIDDRANRRERPLSGSSKLCRVSPRMCSPTTQLRYALYLAPPTKTELWRFGCDVIGRDAMTGASCNGFAPEGRSPAYYLDAWGYPYVLDEFRPHFTLTNAISDALRVARALEWEFSLRVASGRFARLACRRADAFHRKRARRRIQYFASLPA